jgi:hypothetical protein
VRYTGKGLPVNADGTADTPAQQRVNLYREATEAAAAECREVQAEIVSLEARANSLRVRETALIGLVLATRELLPVLPERPAVYTPVRAISYTPPEPRHASWETESATA